MVVVDIMVKFKCDGHDYGGGDDHGGGDVHGCSDRDGDCIVSIVSIAPVIVQLRKVQLWLEFNDLFELRILIYLLLRHIFFAMVAPTKLARKQPFSELAKPIQLLS